jgi:hypothetical protein
MRRTGSIKQHRRTRLIREFLRYQAVFENQARLKVAWFKLLVHLGASGNKFECQRTHSGELWSTLFLTTRSVRL